jgi:hypothetical protein
MSIKQQTQTIIKKTKQIKKVKEELLQELKGDWK